MAWLVPPCIALRHYPQGSTGALALYALALAALLVNRLVTNTVKKYQRSQSGACQWPG